VDDAHHHPVYPQAAFDARQFQHDPRVLCAPNPCMLRINDMTVGINNVDVLRHMGGQELNVGNASLKRMARLANHLVEQQSFYPLLSSQPQGINIDRTFRSSLRLKHTPDLLILSSKLKHFVAPISGGCIAMNTETLTKGGSGGFYGVVTVHGMDEDELRAMEDDELKHTNVADRMRCDIVNI
jgi:DNA polymerase alpha subunit B